MKTVPVATPLWGVYLLGGDTSRTAHSAVATAPIRGIRAIRGLPLRVHSCSFVVKKAPKKSKK